MGFSFFPLFSCSASGFMRQLNKAVNAWESLRTFYVCVRVCARLQARLCMCVHAPALAFYLHQGPQSRRQSLVPYSSRFFPKNKARIKPMNKREWLIPKPKPKVRHLSRGLTLIESILMQPELNEYSIIYRLYMRWAAGGRQAVWTAAGVGAARLRPSLDNHHRHLTAQ